MTTVIYGINNCESVKKAKLWLTENKIEFSFHDFRKNGLHEDIVHKWTNQIQWESLLNRRGTTWRGIEQKIKDQIHDTNIVNFLCKNPTVIKRPVLERGERLIVGFNETNYGEFFK